MRILVLGDSQGEALGHAMERYLDASLSDDVAEVVAQSGISTRAFLDRHLGTDAEGFDVVLVVLGGNDSPVSNYPEILHTAVDVFSDLGRRLIWIGPSQSDNREVAARHDAVRAIQARVLPALGVEFLDPRTWQVGPAGEHSADGTHFTRRAYDRQALEVLDRIRESGFPWGWVAFGVGAVAILGYALAQR